VINISETISKLVEAVRRVDFPDAKTTAALRDLDIAGARITETKGGSWGIDIGRLAGGAIEVAVLGGVKPRRTLHLIFLNPAIPFRNVSGETFGANQRVKLSKCSPGLGLVFEKAGLPCGMTASAPDGVIESLFCEEPPVAPHR